MKPNLLAAERPPIFPRRWLGIIGADFFQRHVLTIDFERRRLLVQPAGTFREDSLTRLRLKTVSNGNPVLQDLRLGSLAPRDYLLDLGNNGPVLIQRKDEAGLRRALGDDARVYALRQGDTRDASGQAIASGYFVKTLAGINGRASPAFEIAGLANASRRQPYDNIGLAFLRQVFVTCTIDFGGGWFYYRLRAGPGEAEPYDREVYFRQADGQFFTGPVLINSSWFRQGLRPEMEVLRINEQSPSVYEALRRKGLQPVLQSIRFRDRDTIRTITRTK